jgi:hypothetical protein
MSYLQLPIMPVYSMGGETHAAATLSNVAIALGRVTLLPNHHLIRRPGEKQNMELYSTRSKQIRASSYHRETLFHEIDADLQPVDSLIKELYAQGRGNETVSLGGTSLQAWAQSGVRALSAHLERSWDPTARHVVMHSSGFDSRLVSVLLKQLAKKHGMDWIGETKFVCFEPEVSYAKAVYDHIGWPASMWHPIRRPPVDYYAPCLDFATIGANLSDTERFWGGPLLVQTQLAAFLDAPNVQGVSALFGDETMKWNRLGWGDWAWFLGCFHFDNPGVMPGRPECSFIFPFVGLEWLRFMSRVRLPEFSVYPDRIRTRLRNACANPSAIDAMKQAMLEVASGNQLAGMPNFRFQVRAMRERNGGHIDQQKISEKTAAKMEADYAASWYAQNVGPVTLNYQKERTFVYWSDRNSHYMKAAICEHLLRAGVTIDR